MGLGTSFKDLGGFRVVEDCFVCFVRYFVFGVGSECWVIDYLVFFLVRM